MTQGREPQSNQVPAPDIVSPRPGGDLKDGVGRGLGPALAMLWSGALRNHHAVAISRSVHWFVPIGLVVGLGWMGAYRLAWRLFGDPDVTQVRLLPALAVLWLEMGVTGRALISGFWSCFARPEADAAPDGTARPAQDRSAISAAVWTTGPLMVVTFLVLIVSLPERIGWYAASDDWRAWFNPIYPIATYRPLLLAPLWGRWGVLLGSGIGSPSNRADELFRGVSRAARPLPVMGWMALLVLLGALYANRESHVEGALATGLLVLLITYLFAARLALRRGGQDRAGALACGFVAECVFLALYRWLCV